MDEKNENNKIDNLKEEEVYKKNVKKNNILLIIVGIIIGIIVTLIVEIIVFAISNISKNSKYDNTQKSTNIQGTSYFNFEKPIIYLLLTYLNLFE